MEQGILSAKYYERPNLDFMLHFNSIVNKIPHGNNKGLQ